MPDATFPTIPAGTTTTTAPTSDDSIAIRRGLAVLRTRLLDLTGHNRLINFKHTPGKSLQLAQGHVDKLYWQLDRAGRITIDPIPDPAPAEWLQQAGRSVRPDVMNYARQVGITPTYDLGAVRNALPPGHASGTHVRAILYAEDLGTHCRKLEREATLAIQETGANMLSLVLGFLEFPDVPGSNKMMMAPLVCIPVKLESIDAPRYPVYQFVATEEDITINLSLHAKVKRDHGLVLPEFNGDTMSVLEYLETLRATTRHLPGWHVHERASLAMLSFSNMLMVAGLDPDNWPEVNGESTLVQHPIVGSVFAGAQVKDEKSIAYANEYVVDEHRHANLPLIYDADSSQHSALIDVMDGKSIVIEGPPGTGKSQTITNLVAAALYQGKKVLFVAEKLAALQVVKSRLTQAGLGNFVLELHSNKTSKRQMIDELNRRISLHVAAPVGLEASLTRLETKRSELKAYADLLNAVQGNQLGLTVHQVLWRAERYRRGAGDGAQSVCNLVVERAPATKAPEFTTAYDLLHVVARQYDRIGTYGREHPWWGFFPQTMAPGDDLRVERVLTTFHPRFEAFAAAFEGIYELLNDYALELDAESTQQLLNALSNIAPANPKEIDFGLLPRLFDPDGDASWRLLQELKKRMAELTACRLRIAGRWIGSKPASDEAIAVMGNTQFTVGQLGLSSLPIHEIDHRMESVDRTRSHTIPALATIASLATDLKLPSSDKVEDVERVRLLLAEVDGAPDNLLHLRHAALANPDAQRILESAQTELLTLQAERATLNELFYLDMLPSDEVLLQAIFVLREGDAWYRIFQGRWRRSVALHRTLDRLKNKKTSVKRLTELERLLWHRERFKAWHAAPALQRIAGPHYDGEKTDFARLMALASWLQYALQRMARAQVDIAIFDPLTVTPTQLAALRSVSARAQVPLLHLAEFEAIPTAVLPTVQPVVREEFAAPQWSARIKHAERYVKTISALTQHLRGNVPRTLSIDEALIVAHASNRARQIEQELANHAEARKLLGDRYAGAATDLERIEATHRYGQLVRQAKLPFEVEAVLLGENSLANYETLRHLIEVINSGWETVSGFIAAMKAIGPFDCARWTEAEDETAPNLAAALVAQGSKALAQMDELLPWVQYVQQREAASHHALLPFIAELEAGKLTSGQLANAYGYRFHASIAASLFRMVPQLAQFSGTRHSTVREEFAALDREIIAMRGKQVAIASSESARPPVGVNSALVGEKTGMALVNHLLPQTQPRVPVRQMLSRAGQAILELKPCFMMGPQAVAQFLEPGVLEFDLVVMDEASQMKPEQAIGAIARGKQLVVVGDPKQLPPTSFFSRGTGTADGAADDGGQVAVDAESILDVCLGHFQPVRSLRWHYRSRHESLIAFSNHYFYSGNLFIFPSPYAKGAALGVRYHYLPDAIYDAQMNPAEARRVVDAVVDHILHRPDDSLGVVTLNIKQAELIAELLDARLQSLSQAHEFRQMWKDRGMELFVKNLETVQGDERDCIIISTTFGRAPGVSKPRQNFGPISRDGGWRRLNVLFTRARKSIVVFSSMRPEDIIVDNKTPRGTRALRDYLEYARSGLLTQQQETGLPPDSDFEQAVIDVLKEKGYEVTPQLGVAGFRIDVAVKHPHHLSGYLAAIECDGATYHSGVSVRDRDRIRQEILENLGWRGRIWRIWSTDWFRDPSTEAAKMFSFLAKLAAQPLPPEYSTPPVVINTVGVDATALEQSVPRDVTVGNHMGVAQDLIDYRHTETSHIPILIADEDDSDLEVEVGDLVTYKAFDAVSDTAPMTVRITSRQHAPEQGFVAEYTPLAQAMLGATIGETIVLRVPSRPPQSFLIKAIKRMTVET